MYAKTTKIPTYVECLNAAAGFAATADETDGMSDNIGSFF